MRQSGIGGTFGYNGNDLMEANLMEAKMRTSAARLMMVRVIGILPVGLLSLGLFALPIVAHSQGQPRGNPQDGLRLARQWCTGCHVVEPAGRGGDAGPSFASVANRPDRTPQTLRAWLNDPHPPMPNLGLSGREIDDIVVYIETLQGRV